ncbi:MAG TPA: uroporphyrinogen-III synthase [Hanamia sp.]|nr:uroporphyrinogen-III synthase [Hanamia sp.]
MENSIQILSTKKIGNSLIKIAAARNICIDELNFIETQESISEETKRGILELSREMTTAVFTSSNAVNAVGKIVEEQTNWKIFCIEPATRKTVEIVFPNSSIAASAKNAEELAGKIIEDKSVKQIVFFCGNQRRDLLVEKLKSNGIEVEEFVVYKTLEKPQTISKHYDGILFFSPSAVRSFFAKNKLDTTTQIFAIGKTTADEVKTFSNNSMVISEIPATENLVDEVIKYFTTIKTV